MTNTEIKELLDWFLPRKIKTRVLRLGERLRNYCCNDQSLFQKNTELKGLEAPSVRILVRPPWWDLIQQPEGESG